MAKYNIPVTITRRDEKYIRDELRGYIDGNLCDELCYAHDTNGLPSPVKELMDAAVDKLYPGFVKFLIKEASAEIDITQDAIDLVFDYRPLHTSIDKIAGRKDVQAIAKEDSRASRLRELHHQAEVLGMKVLPDDD